MTQTPPLPPAKPRCVIITSPFLSSNETVQIGGWIIERVIAPVLERSPFGFQIDISSSSMKRVTGQNISQIAKADLIVADLTGHPPEVFYYLASAHALNKRVVHLILRNQTLPFDPKEYQTLFYDMNWIADKAKAEQIFRTCVEDVLSAAAPPINPVAAARAWRMMERSKDPRNEMIATLSRQVTELSSRIDRVEQEKSQPDSLNRSVQNVIEEWEKELEALKHLRRSLEAECSNTPQGRLQKYRENFSQGAPSSPGIPFTPYQV